MSKEQSPGVIGQSAFSVSELRQLAHITQDAEQHQQFADAVYQTKVAISAVPNTTWDELPSIAGGSVTQGGPLLEESFQRFEKNRNASNFWRKKFGENAQSTASEIATKTGIPNAHSINGIRFHPGSIVLYLEGNAANDFYNQINIKIGGRPLEHFSVLGFTGNNLYIDDPEGNQTGIVIIASQEEENHSVIPHEREHILFGQYYAREPYKSLQESNSPLQAKVKALVTHELDGSDDPDTIESVTEQYMNNELKRFQLLFYNECVAMTAEESDISPRKIQFFASSMQPFPYPYTKPKHGYGNTLLQVSDGVADAIRYSDIPEDDKIRIWASQQKQIATFYAQNREIGAWIDKLRMKQQGDPIQTSSILESIPLSRIWSIGHFIDLDPADLKEQLVNTQPENNEAYWSFIMDLLNRSKEKLRESAIMSSEGSECSYDVTQAFVLAESIKHINDMIISSGADIQIDDDLGTLAVLTFLSEEFNIKILSKRNPNV